MGSLMATPACSAQAIHAYSSYMATQPSTFCGIVKLAFILSYNNKCYLQLIAPL